MANGRLSLTSTRREAWAIVVLPLLCLILGAVSGYLTNSGPNSWYDGLQKSPLTPPSWAFGVVWPALYLLMGLAAAIVYRSAARRQDKRVALNLFAIQLIVNLTWSWVFFKLHMIGGGVVHIAILWLLVAATFLHFRKVSGAAAALLLPYVLWVSFAAYLAFSVWRLNP